MCNRFMKIFGRKQKDKQKKGNYHLLRKTAIITSLGIFLTYTSAYAVETELSNVYHVYVDHEYIGKVDNKEIVEQVADQKVDETVHKYSNLHITVGESISFVQEKVFNPTYNNEKVKKLLEETLIAKAQVAAIKIGDEIVGYFKDEETAKNVIRNYKLKYINEADLKSLEENKKDGEKQQITLAVGDSITKDITFSKEVSISNAIVLPNEVLDEKQGLSYLEKGAIEEKTYKVSEGDVLGKIASKFDLSMKKLLELNPSFSADNVLRIGQEINVTELKPLLDVIVTEEKKTEEKIAYEKEVIESNELYKGDQQVKQKGQDGVKEVQYKLTFSNGKIVNKEVVSETVKKKAVKEIIIKGTKVIPSRGTGKLSWPADGGTVTSHLGMRWGAMHKGIDIAGPRSRSILAADNGVVVSAGWNNGGY